MKRTQSELQDFVRQFETIFMEKIPFNKLVGMHVQSLNVDSAEIRIDMREELVGNFMQGILHGGVISSVLDAAGGLAAFMSILRKIDAVPDNEKLDRLSRFGTIDLRIDFLRPGRGKHFNASATVLRTGNKVAVTRMELHNDERSLIAVGTGTYAVV